MPYISIRQNGTDLGWRELDGAAVVIGRQKECDIPLIDMLMSRNHCRIEPTANGNGWVLVDLASKNGTWHDETPIERMELTPGSRVRVGRTTLTFHPDAPPSEGRYVSKVSTRPSDPHEALAGTVMGMVVVEDGPAERPADPWAARRAARPRPTPRPSGESGIYPAITDASVAVHEPSSGACALLRESRQTDEARTLPDLSDELSVREPVAPRLRVLPRPILLEVQVAAEQEEREAAAATAQEQAVRAKILDAPRPRRRRWHDRLPITQEGVVIFLAIALLGFFRLAIDPSSPDAAVGQPAAVAPAEPTFDVGLMAATPADLPPLSVTATPEPLDAAPSQTMDDDDDDDDADDEVAPEISPFTISAKKLKRALTWDALSGAVKDYQREVRRFVLELPSLDQTAANDAEH